MKHVVIVGAGFAGLGMAIRLKRAGIDDFTILEQADEVGGTWRDNHYPGAACDVQSHLYSYSFEPNPNWTRTFAGQPEILAYLVQCADKYGIRPHIRFRTGVARARFDESAAMWRVETTRGETIEARIVVSACGALSRPALPDIPGLPSFAGKVFHSARWDHSYPLEGKRVAVVGTGASAIQIVPSIAPRVDRLYVLQRTPPWILPKPDRPFGKIERTLFRRVPAFQHLSRSAIYWQRESLALGFVVEPRIMKVLGRIATRYLRASVPDVALRTKLTPRYTMGCKRILPTNDWYPALQRDNVELVTDAISEVLPNGLVTADGKPRALDAIVLATGFEAAEQMAPFEVQGRGGRKLDDAWREGAEAYLGTTVSGFPNLFLLVGPNTGLGHNSMIFMIEAQVAYVMSAIETMREKRLDLVDVLPDAQARYNRRVHERLRGTVWSSGCTSWYQTRSGKNTTLWPGFTFEFRMRTRKFDAAAYETSPSSTGAADRA
jgi:cation diffusion facilitator CzcD-associated flavoprotein CzcO